MTGIFGTEPQRCDPSSAQDHKGVWGICPQRRRKRNLGTEPQRRREKERKKEKNINTMAILAVLMLSGGSTELAYAGPGDVGMAVIDLGMPTVYAFNEAVVSSRNGLMGTATLSGTSIDGARVPLFETTVGFVETLNVTYYAWPELATLTFEGTDGDGLAISARLPVRRAVFSAEGEALIDADAEALAALGFPFRHQPPGTPRLSISRAELAGDGPEQAARTAVNELFITSRRAAPLFFLTLWTAVVIVAVLLWRRQQVEQVATAASHKYRQPALVMTAFLCVAGAATAIAFVLGTVPAELFAVAIPAEQAGGLRGTEAGSAVLVRQSTGQGSYRSVSWSQPEESGAGAGRLWFIGIRSPQSAAVPVSAFSGYRRLSFKYPPLVVTTADGKAMLAPAPFMLAWGLHE